MKNKKFLRFYILILTLGVSTFFNKASAQELEFKMPFSTGEEWKVTQGYEGDGWGSGIPTHNIDNKDRYALDFSIPGEADLGKSVVASESGIAYIKEQIRNGRLVGYGKYVDVYHENGLISRYAHLLNFAISDGEIVSRGQKIGEVNNTGYDGGSHLHFAVYTSDFQPYKPEPMSGYTNFTAGNWYESDNELYDSEDLKVNIEVVKGRIEEGGFWQKIGDFLSGIWQNMSGSLGDVVDDLNSEVELTEMPSQPENEQENVELEVVEDSSIDSTNVGEKIYNLELVSQSNQNLKLKSGETTELSVKFRNTGNQSWTPGVVSLNIDETKNYLSQNFYHNSWVTSRRPAKLNQSEIKSGEIGEFNFTIQAPESLSDGVYEIYFRPVKYLNGKFSWLGGDYDLHWIVEVDNSENEIVDFLEEKDETEFEPPSFPEEGEVVVPLSEDEEEIQNDEGEEDDGEVLGEKIINEEEPEDESGGDEVTLDNRGRPYRRRSTPTIQTSPNDYLKVVINEVAWGGSVESSDNEWIELYNNTADILDLAGWKLKIGESVYELSKKIDAYGFLVINRAEAMTLILEQSFEERIYWEPELNDAGDYLELLNPAGEIVDYVDCKDGWFAGEFVEQTFYSMERVDSSLAGSEDNWQSYNAGTSIAYVDEYYNIEVFGTPTFPNSVSCTGDVSGYTALERNYSGDLHLTKEGSPYFISEILAVSGDLTVDPGVVIRTSGFSHRSSEHEISINVSGKCEMVGNLIEPIVMTSTFDNNYEATIPQDKILKQRNKYPSAQWGALQCQDGAEIDYLKARFGFGAILKGDVSVTNSEFVGMRDYAVRVLESPTSYLANNTVINTRQDFGQGFVLENALNSVVENNNFYNAEEIVSVRRQSGLRIENNASNIPAYINYYKMYRRASGAVGAQNYYTEVVGPSYWGVNSNVVYYLWGITSVFNSLEIASTNVVKFCSYEAPQYANYSRGGFIVDSQNDYGTSASLIARDVVFTSDIDYNYLTPSKIVYNQDQGGKRLYFLAREGAEIELSNVLIRNAESERLNGRMQFFDSTAKLDNLTFDETNNSIYDAILEINNPQEGSYLTNSNFNLNGKALRVDLKDALMQTRYNNFNVDPLTLDAVVGTILADDQLETDVVDMQENWWGDSSGPTCEDNPEGLGAQVSGNVDFSGWSEAVY